MKALLAPILGLLFGITSAWADQNDPRLDGWFAQLQAGEGDLALAQESIEAAWVQAPETGIGILLDRAVRSLEAGRPTQAAVFAGHITEMAPSFAAGWALKGHIAMVDADFETAKAAYKTTLSLEPRHYTALERLADIAELEGDPYEAQRLLGGALKWNPVLPSAKAKAARLLEEIGGQEI